MQEGIESGGNKVIPHFIFVCDSLSFLSHFSLHSSHVQRRDEEERDGKVNPLEIDIKRIKGRWTRRETKGTWKMKLVRRQQREREREREKIE